MPRISRSGFPFLGYRFLTASQVAPRGYVVGDASLVSQGFMIDPIEGKLMRRGGAASVGSETGLLETLVADATVKGLQIVPFDSPSLTDGYPTHLVLFADEAKAAAWLYWRSTNGGNDRHFGQVATSNHYTIDTAVGSEAIYIVLAHEANATGMTRYNDAHPAAAGSELSRRFAVSGSRRLIQVGTDLFSPGYTSTPACWRGKRFNEVAASGTELERFGPTGLAPPLWPGRFVTANLPAATTTAAAWKENDQFYASVAFVNANGEVSMPWIPSGATGVTFAGEYATDMGLVTVPSSDANVNYYQYLRRTAVPLGPGGTAARLMLRSFKVDSSLAGSVPVRLKLYVCGIINDNTTTTFDDYNGDDLSLIEAPELVRLDRKWPDRARYIWTHDQRACVSYLRPNPNAIILAPTGYAASRDVNPADSDPVPSAAFFCVRVISGTLQLRVGNAGITGTTSITIGASTTLRQVVDAINGTLGDVANGREWAAQIVPGVSEDIASNNLMLTYFTVAACTTAAGSPTMTTANNFNEVAVGMRVSGTNIPANTYVKSIESATSLTMTQNASGNIGGAAEFSVDAGNDDANLAASVTLGNIWVLGGSWPLPLPFKKSYLDTLPTLKRDLSFTTGGPLDPPYAANSYVAGNRRSAPGDVGISMGGAPLLDGALTCYSRGVGRLRNIRGGKTGEDGDYRNEVWAWGRGCISPYSIVHGNGWVGYLSDVGYVVSDGQNERVISLAVYNPASKEGEWAYEIGQCKNAAETDGAGYYFMAHVAEGKLFVSYRRSASNITPAHVMVYDFNGSLESVGLAQVLRPDGVPWGWSTPLTYSWRAHSATAGIAGAIGSVRKSDGVYLYVCDDTNDKTTGGLLQRIENGTWTDGSARVTADGYLALDLHETFDKVTAEQVQVMYYAPGAAEQMKFYRTATQAGGVTIALPVGASPYRIETINLPLISRGLARQTQMLLHALGGVGSTQVHYFGAELKLADRPAYRTTGG